MCPAWSDTGEGGAVNLSGWAAGRKLEFDDKLLQGWLDKALSRADDRALFGLGSGQSGRDKLKREYTATMQRWEEVE
jgi:hypothetical protein